MNHSPIWSPDGRAITFATLGKGFFRTGAAENTPRETLYGTERPVAPFDWTPDGKTLVYVANDPLGIWTLTSSDNGGPAEPRPFLAENGINYSDPDLSPDGRRLAYVAAPLGQPPEVYVCLFEDPRKIVMISKGGGRSPRWSRDGRELFYLSADRSLMAVAMATDVTLRAGSPRQLMTDAGLFDVAADNERFLILTRSVPEQVIGISNWFAELRQKTAASRP
jgi:Tol biopolymer transport system component